MRAIYYICAQPANYYYSWQVDAMLLSFEENGQVDLSRVHIVSALQEGKPADAWFLKVAKKWAQKGVTFAYYEDTRLEHGYISSVRPHILEKHWQANPWLVNETIMYHDCDIVLTQPIPLHDKLAPGLETTCFLSDTKSYIGAEYIESKGHGLLEDMCDIVGISPALVRLKESESGGAQYLIKPGIDAQFWKEVYIYSEQLFTQIGQRVRQIKQEEPEWHELQIWCADMWAVLWSLWKRGYTTPCHEDLDFVWGTQTAERWDKLPIFHNAGVVKEVAGQPFYKAKYQHKSPITAPQPDEKWASHKYFNLVTRAHAATAATENDGNSTSLPRSQHKYIEIDGRTCAVYTDVYLTKNGIIYLTDDNKTLKSVNLWTNTIGWQPEQRSFIDTPIKEIDLATYSSFPWTANIGHALFDDLYPIWCAFLAAGYQDQDFTAITGRNDGNNPKSIEAITKFTGRNLLEADLLTEGTVIKINTLVVGTPDTGNVVMSADRKLWGEDQINAMSKFRERFWNRLGVTASENKRTKCAIIANKRFSDKDLQELQIQRDDMDIEHIDWADFSSFEEQIKYLSSVDILISGPGNAIMYTPLMKPGATCINLGWIEKTQSNTSRPNIFIDDTEFEEHAFPAFMEQSVLNTQQDLNILYYDRWTYTDIIKPVVEGYLTGNPSSREANTGLAKDSQIYKKYCESVDNSAEVVAMMTGLALFPEFLVNEHPACLKSGIIDVALLRKIRKEFNYDERWVIKTKQATTTHIAVVATNIYFLLGLRFIRQFHTYCQEQNIKYHFFSDLDPTPYLKAGMQCQYYPEQHADWQAATNSKFKNMLQIQMAEEDTLFYFDADTSISKPFSTAWFQIGDLVGGEHFGNTGHLAGNTGYDRNPESMAYVPLTSTRPATYFYGAFFGGRAAQIQAFCKQLISWQEWDSQCLDYEPAVNDESYINKYFHYRPPATVASAQFGFNISDKGGLDHYRNATGPTAQQLQAALRLANADWTIRDGQVTQID